jgi:DNA-binding transcriptional ArsR family regulator
MHALAALADPTRRRIVELLAARERTAGEIVAEFDLTAPAISQHLKVLRRAGLLRVRADGQHRVQMLHPAGLAEIETWLARTIRSFERQLAPDEKSQRTVPEETGRPQKRARTVAASRQKLVSKD